MTVGAAFGPRAISEAGDFILRAVAVSAHLTSPRPAVILL